jgi:hypothetical protein
LSAAPRASPVTVVPLSTASGTALRLTLTGALGVAAPAAAPVSSVVGWATVFGLDAGSSPPPPKIRMPATASTAITPSAPPTMAATRPGERPSPASVRGRAPAGVRGGREADAVGARSAAGRGVGAVGPAAGGTGAPVAPGAPGAGDAAADAAAAAPAAAVAAGTGGLASASSGLGCGPKGLGSAAVAAAPLSSGFLASPSSPAPSVASPSFFSSAGLACVSGGGTAAPLPVPF